MNVVLSPEATEDLSNATHWYEEQRAGLGDQFINAVGETFVRIAERPLAAPSS
jgi:hypothetical protein